LLMFARRWLYEHRLIIVHGRMLRTVIATSVQQFETELAASIRPHRSAGAPPHPNREAARGNPGAVGRCRA